MHTARVCTGDNDKLEPMRTLLTCQLDPPIVQQLTNSRRVDRDYLVSTAISAMARQVRRAVLDSVPADIAERWDKKYDFDSFLLIIERCELKTSQIRFCVWKMSDIMCTQDMKYILKHLISGKRNPFKEASEYALAARKLVRTAALCAHMDSIDHTRMNKVRNTFFGHLPSTKAEQLKKDPFTTEISSAMLSKAIAPLAPLVWDAVHLSLPDKEFDRFENKCPF